MHGLSNVCSGKACQMSLQILVEHRLAVRLSKRLSYEMECTG
jgi:hypothetical protein